jgi:hypothetical protein
MDSTHATVGVTATAAMAALTTLLTGFHGFDEPHAAAAAFLIVTGLGGLGMLVGWWVTWKWPSAPPFPQRVP